MVHFLFRTLRVLIRFPLDVFSLFEKWGVGSPGVCLGFLSLAVTLEWVRPPCLCKCVCDVCVFVAARSLGSRSCMTEGP